MLNCARTHCTARTPFKPTKKALGLYAGDLLDIADDINGLRNRPHPTRA